VSELTGDSKEERLTRKRLAAEEGAKALEEVAKKAVDVRANMARLRALRLAKEAQGFAQRNLVALQNTTVSLCTTLQDRTPNKNTY
jgi:hypothetical protein